MLKSLRHVFEIHSTKSFQGLAKSILIPRLEGGNRNPSPFNTTHCANQQLQCDMKSLQILQSKRSVFSLIVCPSLDIQEEMHQEDGKSHVSLKACHSSVCPGMLPRICVNKQALYINKYTTSSGCKVERAPLPPSPLSRAAPGRVVPLCPTAAPARSAPAHLLHGARCRSRCHPLHAPRSPRGNFAGSRSGAAAVRPRAASYLHVALVHPAGRAAGAPQAGGLGAGWEGAPGSSPVRSAERKKEKKKKPNPGRAIFVKDSVRPGSSRIALGNPTRRAASLPPSSPPVSLLPLSPFTAVPQAAPELFLAGCWGEAGRAAAAAAAEPPGGERRGAERGRPLPGLGSARRRCCPARPRPPPPSLLSSSRPPSLLPSLPPAAEGARGFRGRAEPAERSDAGRGAARVPGSCGPAGACGLPLRRGI